MRKSIDGFEIICIGSVTYKYLFEVCEEQQVPLKIE